MAYYKNVDVANLKNAIYNCKNSVSYSKDLEILNNLKSGTEWNCSAKKNLLQAIQFIVNRKLKKLDSAYSLFLTLAGYIKSYQYYQKRYEYLKEKLNRTSYEDKWLRNYLKREKNECYNEMNSLKNLIQNTKNSIFEKLENNSYY